MLSRVADSLYWMSRYIERAENDARILDVNLQLLLDLGGEAEAMQHWAPVIASLEETDLFDSLYDTADERSVTEFLSSAKEKSEFDFLLPHPGARECSDDARTDFQRDVGTD